MVAAAPGRVPFERIKNLHGNLHFNRKLDLRPEAIARRAAAIRATWDNATERSRRTGVHAMPWVVPEVSTVDLDFRPEDLVSR